MTFLRLPEIHSLLCERVGAEGMPMVTRSGLRLSPNSEAIFRTLLACSVKRKGGREKRARITGSYSKKKKKKKLPGCSDPAGLKRRQRGALSLSDKWTSSIDCKVYWWGVQVGPGHNGCFSV